MAPEQARGEKGVDKRADIWAFAVVLYEMLTAKRLFQGEDFSDILASVIKDQPSLDGVPQQVLPLLKRCLEKDPRKRLRDIGDWELLLVSAESATAPSPSRLSMGRGWIAAGVLAVGFLAASWTAWRATRPSAAPVVTRFRFTLPEGQRFTRTERHDLALSPDGTKLAYVANNQLYLRAMDQLDAEPIRGANEDPAKPVFSPDGQSIAYFVVAQGAASVQLKKIALSGGAPVTLNSQAPGLLFGAVWSGGNIVFGVNFHGDSSISVVPDSGGPIRALWKADPKKERVAQPRLLADGKHMVFVSQPIQTDSASEGDIVVQTLDGGDRRKLVGGGTDPHMLPSGQLVYIHDEALFAVPFDIRRLAVTGGPVPLLEGVRHTVNSLAGQFAISRDGTLAFWPGGAAAATPRRLLWVGRDGREQAIAAAPKSYRQPRLAPDGARIAVAAEDEEHDLWIYDLTRETLTRETFGPAFEYTPVWAPDGRSLFFASGPVTTNAGVPFDIYRKAADGTGAPAALTEHLRGGYPQSLAPGGTSLIYFNSSAQGNAIGGIYQLPLEPKGPAQPLLADPKFRQASGEVSPDGRWIAYASTESGHDEIYVRPFPAVNGGRWQISSGGGTKPAWARSGRELFFLDAAGRMSLVAVKPGAGFSFGKPSVLFDAGPYYENAVFRSYDVSADGKRFLMVKDVAREGSEQQAVVVVSHWFDEVKAKMPAQR